MLTKKEEALSPPQLTTEQLEKILKMMDEFAEVPKEAMGQRTPGERCMYEIQRKQTLDRQ